MTENEGQHAVQQNDEQKPPTGPDGAQANVDADKVEYAPGTEPTEADAAWREDHGTFDNTDDEQDNSARPNMA